MPLPRRWILAVVGSVLILGSTFISGYLVDHYERQATRAEAAAREAETSYWLSVGNMDSAESEMAHASILWSSAVSGPEMLQAVARYQLSLGWRGAVDEMKLAAGPNVDEELTRRLYTLANEAGMEGGWDFVGEMGKLMNDVEEYQAQLRQEQPEFEKEAASAEQSAARARSIAIALQLVGLVLLLLREIPEKPAAKKEPSPLSTS
jgi:hypothetical protein